jgi:phosphohistidine phosphatase
VPDLVLCSPARRARETLEGIASAFGDEPQVAVEAELYGAAPDQLLERLHRVPADLPSVMLIGHNPAVHDLALELAGEGDQLDRLAQKLPTGALATLAFDAAWAALRPGLAELVAFVRPKDLG